MNTLIIIKKLVVIRWIVVTAFVFNGLSLMAQVNADFTFTRSCDGVVAFTPKNTAYDSYLWDFGNSATSTLINPSVNYAAGAIKKYTVSLTVTYKGVSVKQTRDIQINPKATAKVIYKNDVCMGQTIKYGVSNPKNHFKYLWECGNADISGDKNSAGISIRWTVAGNYLMTLKVVDNNGCDTVLKFSISVHGIPKPGLNIADKDSIQNKSSLDIICLGNNKEFSIFPVPGIPLNPKSTYLWTSSCAIPKSDPAKDHIVFHFPNTGNCKIKLTETNEFGCSGSIEQEVNVIEKPQIKLGLNDGCLGSPNSYYASAHPRSLVHYQWDFGDGTGSTLKNPEHTYASAGKYNVYFVGTDELGCTDTVKNEISIDIYPGPPITCVGTLCAGDEAVYSTPPITGCSYIWKVTGGTVTGNGTLADNTIKVKWDKATFGEIQLQITGPGQHCKNPARLRINLLGESYPISGNATPCYGVEQIYSTDLVNGAAYSWSVPLPAYIYEGQGTNQVKVNWVDAGKSKITLVIKHAILDCVSTGEMDVTVKDKFMAYGPSTPCIKGVNVYNAYPQTGSYQWETGGYGIIESGQNTASVTIKWLTPGTHQLIVKNATDFCNSQVILNINVQEAPKINIAGAQTVCKSAEEIYTVGGNIMNIDWVILSGGSSLNGLTSNSLQVKWNSIGTHKILALYRSSENYCPDTAVITVTVIDNTMPEILGDSLVCFNQLKNYRLNGNYNSAMLWEISGGDYETAPDNKSVDVKWNGARTGMVRIINTLCYSETEKIITIKPELNPTFVFENLNCDGTTADIKVVEEFKKYTWNTSETTRAITVTKAGKYSVEVETVWGCKGYGEIILSKLPGNKFESASLVLTAGDATSPYPYIIGEIVSVPEAVKYEWETGQTTKQIFVNADGDYTCKITNKFGCTEEFTFNVVVDLNNGTCTSGTCSGNCTGKKITSNCNYPVFSVKNPLCNPVEFTALVSATYYHWDFGDKVYSKDKNPKHRFTTAGNHNINIYFSDDGVDWTLCTQTINVKSLINAGFEPKILCNGVVDFTDKTTSALGITSKLWEFGDTKSSTAANPSHTYTPPIQSYKVKLSINDGLCTDFIEEEVKVNWLKAGFTNKGSCLNIPVSFASTTLHTEVIAAWRWDFGNNLKEYYPDPEITFDKSQNYPVKLVVKDASGCMDSITKGLLIVSPKFAKLSASGPLKFCEGSSITLSAAKNMQYRWNTSDTTPSIIVTKAGQFYVKLTDNITGCKGNSDTIKTQLIPKPKAAITVPYYSSSCENNYYSMNINLSNPNNYTYEWFKNGVWVSKNQNYYIGPSKVSDGGVYKLKLTDKTTGCSDTAINPVAIYPSPKVPVITVKPTGVLCSDQVVTLSAENVEPFDKIQWNTGSFNRKITIYNSNYYTVNVINSFGCGSKASTFVSIFKSPDINAFPTGCYTICENREVEIKLENVSGITYTWSDGFKGSVRKLSQAGVYKITADNGSCISKSGNLNLEILKINSKLLAEDTCLKQGKSKNVNLIPGGLSNIKWSNGSTGNSIQISAPGKYWVSVKTKEGCIITDTLMIDTCKNVYIPPDTSIISKDGDCERSKYFIPNAFSVNNDGINEQYLIPLNNGYTKLSRLVIYNRWGEEVFMTLDPKVSWDGNVNGKQAQLGAYVYICQYTCNGNFFQKMGTVTLIK